MAGRRFDARLMANSMIRAPRAASTGRRTLSITGASVCNTAEENGYRKRGRHHEIYLGDPHRAQPDKLKTVLRQPVEPA